ncbi:mannitol dehydrogenase family protein [Spirosoma litoris]
MKNNNQDILMMLAYPAFLAGYRTVEEALNDHLFSNYLNVFIEQDVMPFAEAQDAIDLNDNRQQWLSQFCQPTSDPLANLCVDGASKLPALILPTLRDLLAQNRDVQRMAFLLAAYGHYLCAGTDDKGVSYELNDAHFHQHDWAKVNSDDVAALLEISTIATARLHTYSHFVAMYKSYRTQIAKYGVVFLLKQMAYNRLAMQQA